MILHPHLVAAAITAHLVVVVVRATVRKRAAAAAMILHPHLVVAIAVKAAATAAITKRKEIIVNIQINYGLLKMISVLL
jgi:hypothetical protein